ncbi:MAG: TIGR00730 family Rossman fold protein [Chloroflexota bacterium]
MKRICVFCGARPGKGDLYEIAAIRLGTVLAERKLDLVYGGSKVGLMGAVANAALQNGGNVIGVMPQSLADKEIQHTALTELHVVSSMFERKAMMAKLSDGFIAMPGGFGTLDEYVEMLTWTQLGFHDKPSALLNVNGFFDKMLGFFEHQIQEGFIEPRQRGMLLVEADPEKLLRQMAAFKPPVARWEK